MQAARLPLQGRFATAELTGIVRQETRRSVSKKAPLQNQFSERMRIGRSRVEKQRRQRCLRIRSDERALIIGMIGLGEFRIVASPALCRDRTNRAQSFAALSSSRRLFLFRRLGMKRALGLRLVDFRCDRRECAMIRDRDPGTDRDRGN